ncbi:regulatory protein RecX [Jiulongibacter sp. NS-SX5]|uniref:regulatory protein RecX n=1 Tax=Jiulongibacter sp. NS-SX5 TaxID=3463854 RepID=UPI004057ED35
MDKLILLKACNYCAYQERTHDEVRQRMADWKVYGDEAEEIIAELITENFLNEERFAKTYAGSKFRVKKWGRNKILQELKRRKLSDYCIKKGMEEIDDEEYFLVLQALLHKKLHNLRTETNEFIRNKKAADYAMRKGFEAGLIWDILRNK